MKNLIFLDTKNRRGIRFDNWRVQLCIKGGLKPTWYNVIGHFYKERSSLK